MCIPEEMGVKDVDLREKRLSEEVPENCPSLSSEALSTENGWGAITGKEQCQELMNCIDFQNSVAHEACVDLQEARSSVDNLDHYKESSGNLNYTGIKPAFPCNPSQVSGLDELEVFSVENDNESSFKSVYDAVGQRDIKDVQSVPENKPVRQEEENQVKETIERTTSSDVLKWWWIIGGLSLCCTFHMVDGAGDTQLVFPPDIELYGQVPQYSRSTWLHGRTTVQKNRVNESSISGQNLRINNSQRIENYNLEISHPDGSRSLQQFPMKAFKMCVVAKNEDLVAFKEGKKVGEVELHGTANVTKHYMLMMQNQTLQIYFKQGTDHKLQPDDVQCKVTFKDIDPGESVSPDNAAAIVEKDSKENSSDDGKYVVTGVVFGAGIAIVVICLVLCFYVIKKRRQSKTAGTPDLEAAALASEEILTRETRISCI